MPEEIQDNKGVRKVTEIEAQDAIAACIPEIEKLAWKFFAISRDLGVDEKDDDFALERPGPEHLRWSISESALAMYYELLELIPYARKRAEVTDARLLSIWDRDTNLGFVPAAEAEKRPSGEDSENRVLLRRARSNFLVCR